MELIKNNVSSVFRSASHSSSTSSSSSSSDIFAELQFNESSGSGSSSHVRRRLHTKAKGKRKRVTWSAEVLDNATVGSLQSPVIILSAALVDVSH